MSFFFQCPDLQIWPISVINICIKIYCLSSELYIGMALETQEQANKTA